MAEPYFNFVVLTRNPRSNKLLFLMDRDENVLEFDDEESARDVADQSGICKAWGYDVIKVAAPTAS